MGQETKIQWTEATWNPIAGCSLVSPGCTNCYAMKMAARLEAMGQTRYAGTTRRGARGAVWTGKVNLIADALDVPLRRRKPTMYFVNSMSDLFHEEVPDEFILQVFGVMIATPWHTYQVLTKRPARLREFHRWWVNEATARRYLDLQPAMALDSIRDLPTDLKRANDYYLEHCDQSDRGRYDSPVPWPLPNLWLGVSAEDQARADERIPILLSIPAVARFVSAEPLLGPIDFGKKELLCATWRKGLTIGTYLDWIIVGGESGPRARPCDLVWIRSIVAQCRDAGAACFVKQLGSAPIGHDGETAVIGHQQGPFGNGSWRRLSDPKGGNIDEFPADLRVRQFPTVGA